MKTAYFSSIIHYSLTSTAQLHLYKCCGSVCTAGEDVIFLLMTYPPCEEESSARKMTNFNVFCKMHNNDTVINLADSKFIHVLTYGIMKVFVHWVYL